jgi:hypothetical protein
LPSCALSRSQYCFFGVVSKSNIKDDKRILWKLLFEVPCFNFAKLKLMYTHYGVLTGADVLVVAPTGMGKVMCSVFK